MAASPQKKFDAAVKVIRGLPKNGSFQPSNELMLKFYAYYKQATEGPCTAPKPGIWNPVNRKKWEAWSELGEMDKDAAMIHYVDELKHIVETMPQTEQVADFVETLGSFYEVIEDGGKVSAVKTPKQPNGSLQPNGGGDENTEAVSEMSEELRVCFKRDRPGHENDGGDGDNASHLPSAEPSQGPTSRVNGITTNGHKDSIEEEEEDVNGDDEIDDDVEEEEEENNNDVDGSSTDSASEGEEFCDTTDHVEQMLKPVKVNTSTPSGPRLENRVRFAPDVSMADESLISGYEGSSLSDRSKALRDMSVLSSQMEKERLRLWTDSEFSFLPPASELPPHSQTESLRVNASFSSLVSLAGSESVAGRNSECPEDSVMEAEDIKHGGEGHVMTCRGGGEERDGGSRTPRSSGRGAGGASSHGGRGGTPQSAHGSSSRGRRALFPSGSGGGEEGRRGQGRLQGCLDEQILLTLLHLQQDMISISNRLAALELNVKLLREEQVKKEQNSKWWPLQGRSKMWGVLLVLWPILTPVLVNLFCQRRRSGPR